MTKPLFIHTVYFWLKDSVSEQDKADFEKGLEALGHSSCTTGYYWGTPLQIEKRGVVDDSYDYGSTTFFASMDQHEIYQSTDPTHLTFIDSFKHLWKDVKVYDHVMK